MNENDEKQRHQMQIFLSAHRLEAFEEATIKKIKYRTFYVEDLDSEDDEMSNDSKLQFAFVEIMISTSNVAIEKSNILQEKIKKANKKNLICNRIRKRLEEIIEAENKNLSNIELCSKKKDLMYFLKKL